MKLKELKQIIKSIDKVFNNLEVCVETDFAIDICDTINIGNISVKLEPEDSPVKDKVVIKFKKNIK